MQVPGGDDVAVQEQRGALEAVLQLANVAGPGVGGQGRHRRVVERRHAGGRARGRRARGNAAPAAPRRRHARAAAAPSPARPRAGSRGPRGTGARPPRRADWRLVAATSRTSAWRVTVPPTRSNSRVSSTRRILAWIDGASSPTSSRNSVPRWASSKRPSLRCASAGERALLVAEELGLEQRLGQGGAVDGDERPLRARAPRVQRPGEELLAGAALAFEQHGDVGRGRPLHRLHGLPQRRRLAENPRRAATHRQLLLEERVLAQQPVSGPAPGPRPATGGRDRPAWPGSRGRRRASPRPRPGCRRRPSSPRPAPTRRRP